jgi:hypothetical protein
VSGRNRYLAVKRPHARLLGKKPFASGESFKRELTELDRELTRDR